MSDHLHPQDESQNAFKQLLEDSAANAPAEHLARVEQQLHRKTNQFRLIGEVIDLFLPNIVRTFFGMIGEEDKKANKNTDPNAPQSRRRRALPDEQQSNGRG